MPAKHTPGPWEARPSFNEQRHWTIEAPILDRSGPVADTLNMDHCISPEEEEANARLMAAAPRMAYAIYYEGGGSVCLETHGRLCFCARHGDGPRSKHATSCNDLWDAWVAAGSPLPPGESVDEKEHQAAKVANPQ